MENKQVTSSKKGNAYLFANLILVVILLIGIWTKSPTLEAKLDFGKLMLFLIIVNSILLFKDVIIKNQPTEKPIRKRAKKGLKSLKPLRALINSAPIDQKLLTSSLEKIKEITEFSYLELCVIENSQAASIASAGIQPQLLSGTRLIYNNSQLSIKHSGQLGSEEICKISEDYKPVKFKSKLTRLCLVIVPLNLRNAKLGLCLFANDKAPYVPNIALGSLAVSLESIITTVEHSKNHSGGYKDKETGLILYKNYEELVDNELERSERYEQEMSLLTIKITNFDRLQDSEKPLISKNIASAMKHSLRRFDLMFYGKEPGSYYALLTESGAEVAEGIATRFQKEFGKLVKKLQFADENKPVLVIGSATYQTDATHSLGLIEKSADACMDAIENNMEFKAFSSTSPEVNKKIGAEENEPRRKND